MDATRVLIVEDDVLTNLALHRILEDYEFRVESVYCGTTALAAIRREPPWALVTDVDLGRGPDGFEVARFARACRPGLPVVILSGREGARHPAEGVPGSEFIAKPCRGEQIVEALRRTAHLEAA
ncbi:MAG TPA: response regulator [Phenylobacterium sp.]